MSTRTNQIATRAAAAQTVNRVAQTLAQRGDRARAAELTRIAQFLGGGDFLGNAGGVGLDRAAEGDFQVSLRDGQGGGGFDPSQDVMQMGNPMGGGGADRRDGEHPGIQPFAKHRQQSQVNPHIIHTVSMTLTAPPDVTETDMLNFILKMRDELGVDATNVQWSKKEQAPNKVSLN
jgi:hypothetical protein